VIVKTTEDEFITRLIGFGLSEKEAQTYLHLLKYGPKTPSPLAKSLKTYREDVHRTLTSLIDKGMVRPSLDSPTIYTAVDLDTALESALLKQQSELREMEARKLELQDLAKQQAFRPSEDVSTFKIIKSVKELVSVSIASVTSIQDEVLFVVPQLMLEIASFFGINDEMEKLIERGGHAQGIIFDGTNAGVKLIQELLDIGEDIRVYDSYRGLPFGVLDEKICLSSINVNIKRASLKEFISLIWTDDRTYASYLMANFELLWAQAIPAAQWIEELLQEGSHVHGG
jgi:sugar-specific transcriptional regulator TrmB